MAIETSCDETAVAFLTYTDGKYSVSSQELYSQAELHKPFGGVFPMLAKREHGKNLIYLAEKAAASTVGPTVGSTLSWSSIDISEERKTLALSFLSREPELQAIFKMHFDNPEAFFYKKPDIEAIAVTVGPGLEPALWVGISFAKALSTLWNIPLLPINHMEGHMASILIDNDNSVDMFPALALLISGGHTEMLSIEKWGKYKIIGNTKDDAIGEAYDKVARILGLDYPGGPEISKRAHIIRQTYTVAEAEQLCRNNNIKLPRPMINSGDAHFSFSGLKTAVLYLVRDLVQDAQTDAQTAEKKLTEEQTHLICVEFEQAVVEVFIKKLETAFSQISYLKSLIAGGGVIANTYIKEALQTWCDANEIIFLKPENALATDNAVMIGAAGLVQLNYGYAKLIQPTISDLSEVVARGGWRIDEIY